MNCVVRKGKVTVYIFSITNYSMKQLLDITCVKERTRYEKYRKYNYKIFPVASRLQTVIITDVMKVCHASQNSRAERKRRLFPVIISLSHVASGHRRCVIHERGINRKLKIVITRGFESLTVISTDIYCPTFPSCENSRKTARGEIYISLYICTPVTIIGMYTDQ